MKTISVVVSCFNEEQALPLFYQEMEKVRQKDFADVQVDFEYVFVDDGSKDHTLEIMKTIAEHDPKVKYLSFSRNFGKESAMLAGLEAATGDYIAIMDADLQDPPALLRQMYDEITENSHDRVGTRRVSRKGEPVIRSFFARMFYRIINKMSKVEMVDGARDYWLMTRQVADALISMREYNRYSKGLNSFVGFDTKWLEYENIERVAGETKWSFWKLFKYAIEGITAFSTVPLILSSLIGLLFCLVAFIAIVFIIVRTLIYGDPTSGWPSLACIIVFVSGIQLFSIGIIGQYLAKTYLEVKKRPIYIIKEQNFPQKKVGAKMKKVYLAHSRGFDYEAELYRPVRNIADVNQEMIILPHEAGYTSKQDRDFYGKLGLVIAEVSYPATGMGIELGWAYDSKVPIVCISKVGAKVSGSLKYITNQFYEYKNTVELSALITKIIQKYS